MTKTERKREVNGILFRCQAPGAHAVFLAGTFNNWDPTATPMERSPEGVDGAWCAKLDLPPGRYEYKFVVDDCWCCEPGDDGQGVPNCVFNEFGTMNRVIEIPAP